MASKDTPKLRQRKSSKPTTPEVTDSKEEVKPVSKYGPLPTFPRQRIWTRMVLILGTLVVVYFTSNVDKTIMLAKQKEALENRRQNVPCSKEFAEEIMHYPGCIPQKCGRSVMDKLVSKDDADRMLEIGMKGLSLGGSDGGASILDLHSGALSKGKNFINIYKLNLTNVFSPKDFETYRIVRQKIQYAISHSFRIHPDSLYLTHPTFFSKLTSEPPATPHDEYWHPHVDKETYKSFHYTSLLYLNDYETDFDGGRFIFIEADNSSVIIEPRRGRVSMFTSGKENLHHVERVKSGTRYAVTVSFTCDSKSGIADPSLSKLV